MPELPEVETTRAGIRPLIIGQTVTAMQIRDRRLRRPISEQLPDILLGQQLEDIQRRAKYLLLRFQTGHLLIHLGMSGSLRVLDKDTAVMKHDHVDIDFDNDRCLRFRDPRRFGLMLWLSGPPYEHDLLAHLGPEPWDETFDADYLHARSRGRTIAVKNFIMDGKIVVGVGNIYANESLHRAGIHPKRAAQRIGVARYERLATAIRSVLDEAIAKGGTTLRDFVKSDGKPGYFRHQLQVYDRAGEPCECGHAAIKHCVIGQRSSYYCPACQH